MLGIYRGAYNPELVTSAVRDCDGFTMDTLDGREFFNRTVCTIRANQDHREVNGLLLPAIVPEGLGSLQSPKAYLIQSNLYNPSPRKLFKAAEHFDSMSMVVVACYVGNLSVRLTNPAKNKRERLDLLPGDLLIFDATKPHSFVPTTPRHSLSIPIIPQS